MNIQFVYIQKKDIEYNNNEYLVILKTNKTNYNFIELNKIIYSELYKVNIDDQDINYMQYMYLKKGLLLYNSDKLETEYIWEKFIKLKLENMKLINLIDNKMTNKILTTDILYFNYNRYKEFLNPIISNIILSYSLLHSFS